MKCLCSVRCTLVWCTLRTLHQDELSGELSLLRRETSEAIEECHFLRRAFQRKSSLHFKSHQKNGSAQSNSRCGLAAAVAAAFSLLERSSTGGGGRRPGDKKLQINDHRIFVEEVHSFLSKAFCTGICSFLLLLLPRLALSCRPHLQILVCS